jgi:hypothetical protein
MEEIREVFWQMPEWHRLVVVAILANITYRALYLLSKVLNWVFK